MKFIGERISILEKENELSIVIFSYRNKFKNILVIAWVIIFSICGILAVSEFRHAVERDSKIFWLVFVSFWVYFELVVFKAVLWRLRGKEKILVTTDMVKIKRDISGFERFKEYSLAQTSEWGRVTTDKNSLVYSYENAYWFVGAERIRFSYYGREVRFASQLSEEETSELLGKLRQYVK